MGETVWLACGGGCAAAAGPWLLVASLWARPAAAADSRCSSAALPPRESEGARVRGGGGVSIDTGEAAGEVSSSAAGAVAEGVGAGSCSRTDRRPSSADARGDTGRSRRRSRSCAADVDAAGGFMTSNESSGGQWQSESVG